MALPIVRGLLTAAYAALLAWIAWATGDRDGVDIATAAAVLATAGWLLGSVLIGAMLGTAGIPFAIVAVVATAAAGEILSEFSADLRLVNWFLQVVMSSTAIALGAGMRRMYVSISKAQSGP